MRFIFGLLFGALVGYVATTYVTANQAQQTTRPVMLPETTDRPAGA